MKNADKEDIKETYVGKDCDKLMGVLKLRYPMKNGVFQNEQDILTVFNNIYNKLDVKSEEIKEHPIFITEPILNPYYHRKQIASVLFDNLGVPALFFGSQPILSLFATNDRSGVVLESGEGITQCCVVYEGYAIPHSYMRFDYGGRQVTEHLQTLLKRVGYSFNSTAEFEIVKKIKETLCYTIISSTSDDNRRLGETGPTNYNLPDGNYITLKEEKVLAPEILFNPSMIGLEYPCNIS
jgi:centractin